MLLGIRRVWETHTFDSTALRGPCVRWTKISFFDSFKKQLKEPSSFEVNSEFGYFFLKMYGPIMGFYPFYQLRVLLKCQLLVKFCENRLFALFPVIKKSMTQIGTNPTLMRGAEAESLGELRSDLKESERLVSADTYLMLSHNSIRATN